MKAQPNASPIKIVSKCYSEEYIVEFEGGTYKRVLGADQIPRWIEQVTVEGEFGWQMLNLQLATDLERKFKKKLIELTEVN